MPLNSTHTLTITLTLQAQHGKEKVVRVLTSEGPEDSEKEDSLLTEQQHNELRRLVTSTINQYFQ